MSSAALAPPAVEDRVVDRPVVAPTNEDCLAGGPHLLAVGDLDERQAAGVVDRCTQVHAQAGRPQRSPEPDGLAEQATAVHGVTPR